MPTTISLLAAVERALTHAAGTTYSNASAVEDVYEAFVWTRLVAAAKSLGWRVTYTNPAGVVSGALVFRLGPGVIHSPQPYSFAKLNHAKWPTLEVHLGIMVDGRSGVSHEYDVFALPDTAAERARRERRNPKFDEVAVHAECKFYGDPLPLGIGRAMWGLSADCRLRQRGGLVTNSAESRSVRQLLDRHGVFYRTRALPHPSGTVYELEKDFRKRLTKWLEYEGHSVP